MIDFSSTIVALATPPGVGAIGVIRLSGPEAIDIASFMFWGKKDLREAKTHTAHFGEIHDNYEHLIDEVLATVFRGPRSYTGEDTVEISCHGSPYILQRIIELALFYGARLAQPGEFTMRAFLNGKMDLSQAEAVADLIASQSEAAHTVALRQLRGGFKNEVARLREELIHFASLVELELDFAEEDVEFADRTALKNLVKRIRTFIQSLMDSFALGNALKTGVATVIAGRPNAGKSTLLNALLNEDRAIVSEIAGTTRDTIEEVLNINGVQFRLIDTAGIREAQDQIEAIGVAKTMEKIEQAAILVYVWDVASGMTLADVFEDLERLTVDGGRQTADGVDEVSGNTAGATVHRQPSTVNRLLVVCNKMDKNPHFDPAWLVRPDSPSIHPYLLEEGRLAQNRVGLVENQIVTLSAKHKMNVEYLTQKLFATVSGGAVNLESTVVTNARHLDALRRADAALADVLTGLDTGITGDFVAQDIRRALAFLGEISGEIGVEDLLENIFSKFCIGK